MEITKDDTSLVKGLAISLMLWHHLFVNTDKFGVLPQKFAVFAKICVAMFLFVSGYGLTKQFSKSAYNNLRLSIAFVLKRLAKFFLSYWFCMVLVMVVGQICGYTFQEAYPSGRNLYKCILFDVLGIFGYNSFLPTWWFNKLIIQLYLLFPILYQFLRNRYCAVAALLSLLAIEQTSCINVFCVVEGGIVTFFLGMMLAKYDFKITKRWVRTAASMITVLVMTIIRFRIPEIRYSIVDSIIVIAIIDLLLQCKRLYSFPVLHYFGRFATIMYLTHTLLQILLGSWLFSINYAVLVYALFMSIALLAAMFVSQLQKWSQVSMLQAWIICRIQAIER